MIKSQNRQKIIIIAGAAAVFSLGVFFLQTQKTAAPASQKQAVEKKLSIVTTLYPLEDFTRTVGGDAVTVKNIIPVGVEPHDYEPTPQDIVSIYQADVFLLNGAGIDSWAEKIRPELEKRGVRVIEMAEVVRTSLVEREESSPQKSFDPHFWLDPLLVREEIGAIHSALTALDPAHAVLYSGNAEQYLLELADLHTRYREGLEECGLRTIVTSHDAFAYLAKRYGITVVSISGLSPESEVAPRVLVAIAEQVRALQVRYIFFETLTSSKVAETLAREVGAETLVFNPLEGLTQEEITVGKNYLSIMRENLSNLQTALECQQ